MTTIINNTVVVIHVFLACLVLVVWVGNFFKKKTLLSKFYLYGDFPLVVSLPAAVVVGLLFMADIMYSYDDVKHESYHLGSLITMAMIGFTFMGCIIYLLMKWNKQIPET